VFFYSVYGLKISSKTLITWFDEIDACQEVDFHLDCEVLGSSPIIDASGYSTYFVADNIDREKNKPWLIVKASPVGEAYHFVYSDGVEILVDNLNSQIIFRWPPEETLEYELGYLAAMIFSFILLLRGHFSFHASALAINGKSIIVLGDSGAGKSTTAAVFAMLGYPILSDDLVTITDNIKNFLVQPAFPLIRLWPESVAALFGRPDALPEIVPNHHSWRKRYLDLRQEGYQFQDRELPLGGVYFLSDRSSDESAPWIEPVPVKEALISLAVNNYSSIFLDKTSRTREFEFLGKISRQIPLRRVVPSTDITRFPQLCEAILKDFEQINKFSSVS
jgi:hypothetical protein